MFPGLEKEVFLQDLIKKKYPVKDRRTGLRLNGTAPYRHDPTVPEQIAFTWMVLEASESVNIVLLGSKVKQEFIARYGKFKNGDEILLGGRPRRVFHIRHPEHTMKYASAQDLGELRATLRLMHTLGFSSPIGFDWIDQLIEGRVKKPPTQKDPPKSEFKLAEPQTVKRLCKVVARCVQSSSTHLAQKNAQAMIKYMRENRSDPNGKWKDQAAKMKALHADPEGSFKDHGKKIKASLQAKKANGDTAMWDNTTATRYQIRLTQEVRWTRSGLSKFDLGSWLKANNRQIAPRASDLSHDEVLYYLPGALQFVGLEVPKTLPRAKVTAIGRHEEHWKVPVSSAKNQAAYQKDLFVSMLCSKVYPTFFTQAERQTHFEGKNPSKAVGAWERRWRFAEDLIGSAQEKGVQGVVDVLFIRKVEHWPQ